MTLLDAAILTAAAIAAVIFFGAPIFAAILVWENRRVTADQIGD